jgi:hypothetical protein
MRHFLSLIVISLIILTLPACSKKDRKWVKYTAGDGSFSIKMPENYTVSEEKENTIFGKQVVHYVSWKPSALSLDIFKSFQVKYTDCPQGMPADTVLNRYIADRIKAFDEVKVEPQSIHIGHYPAREVIYDPPSDIVIIIVKECVADNRLYDISVIAKRNFPTNVESGIFLNSFQVLK